MSRLASTNLPTARLREALRSGPLDDLPDADLLTRFALYHEQAAFEALIRRHGPMVFGVCRRIVANVADAEDAFQAVFLVLVRKARTVRGERLGPWLYGVSYRVARKARGRELRVALRRSEAIDMIPDPTPPVEVPDWLPILDAELSALPAKYREPLVLCELQGASRAVAAKQLGVPEGTLSSRLSRGRELLRRRLLKHGTLLPAGGLAALFTSGGIGRAALPTTLLARTAELAAVVSTGVAPVGAVPAGAAQLTDEVLKGMFLTKLWTGAVALVAAVLIATGVTGAVPGEVPGQGGKPAAGTSPRDNSGGADAADARKDTQGERAAGDGSVGYVRSAPGRNPEGSAAQYKALFEKAMGVLAREFEQISADQYTGRIEAKQPLKGREAAIEIRRSDDGRLVVSARVSRDADGRKHRDADLERAILQRLSAQAEEQPGKPKAASTSTASSAQKQSAKGGEPGAVVKPDREQLQGLWVLEKTDLGKGVRDDERRQVKDVLGKMQVLVTGDMWWGLMVGSPNGVSPARIKLDPSKNPKWIDIADSPGTGGEVRAIYELEGDALRICVANGGNQVRPAEFDLEDDTPLMVMHFRREKLPPPAGDKKLIGDWVGGEVSQSKEFGKRHAQAACVLDSYIFLRSASLREMEWFGGRYTLDTTKNPNWIDVELTAPLADQEKATKLYGCYEVVDGKLKVALGTKRATRPLEFAAGNDTLIFELTASKDATPVYERVLREEVPAPPAPAKPKGAQKPEPKPDRAPAPVRAPAPRPARSADDERAAGFVRTGDYAAAEKQLREQMAGRTGIEVAEKRLLLGVCLVQMAKEHGPAKGEETWKEAAELFKAVADDVRDAAAGSEYYRGILTNAELRRLQVLQLQGKADQLLPAAEKFRDRHAGSVEELIALSFAFHACKQKGDSNGALHTKEKMEELFEKLREKPGAFPAVKGEFSREYWATVWFPPRR